MSGSWPNRPIGELIDGLAAGVSVRSTTGVTAGPAVLKTSAVDRGRFVSSEAKPILPADISRARRNVVADSLIISRMNTPALVGDVGYVQEESPNLFLPDRLWLARAKRGTGTCVRWLTYYLASEPGAKKLQGLATGTSGSMKNIPKGRILALDVPVPGPREQVAIAEALRDADGLIDCLRRLIAKKQAVQQGMMQQLLTGKTRLPGFSKEWRRVKLGEVARFRKGSGLPKSDVSVGGSTPCVHYGELFTKYGPEIDVVEGRTNNKDLSARSEALDVLMPTSDVTPRGLAKASAIRQSGVILGGDILIIRPESTTLFGPFLAQVIRHDANQVLQLVRGSTVYHLYAADMRNFLLDIPAVEEQVAVASALSDARKEIDALRVRLKKARMLKIGMMQELLTARTRLPLKEVQS